MSGKPIPGLTADQLVNVFQDETRQNTRLVFTKDGQPHFLMFQTNHLRALMPQLVLAALPEDAPDLAITVTGINMHVRRSGEALLTLANSDGAEMAFGLSPAQLTQLAGLIVEAQQIQARLAASG
jgi:hypothetical protein